MDKNHERYFIPGLSRGLQVLQLFARGKAALQVSEVAKELGISRSSAFRLTYTLHYLGFLHKDENSKKYQLGSKVLDLGFGYLSSIELIESTRGELEKLRTQLNVSTHLVLRDGLEVVYVARYAARRYITSNIQIGTRFPAHATALGQVLLADLSDDDISQLYDGVELMRYTEHTPTSVVALLERIRLAREQGFIRSWGYFETNLASIAVGIRDFTAATVAAINITCPIDQFSKQEFNDIVTKSICNTASILSQKLGNTRAAA